MEKEYSKTVKILILVFLGWFGGDKFLARGFKGGWKMAGLKFLANLVFIGEAWNIIDLIMECFNKYMYDPRDYLGLIEKKN